MKTALRILLPIAWAFFFFVIAAYAAAMGGVDAVFFTGGIGQRSPEVREAALEGLEFMGIELHRDRNAAATGDEAEITTDASRARVLVVPTNEEKTIARDVIRVLNGVMPVFTPPETVVCAHPTRSGGTPVMWCPVPSRGAHRVPPDTANATG